MARKTRIYEFELCDGHGCERRLIAGNSKAEVKNAVQPTITRHQKVQNFKHLGWHSISVQPDQEECDVSFEATIKGKRVEFTQDHLSHAHLTKQFAQDTKNVRDFLEEKARDER
jgi:hypothetical protein